MKLALAARVVCDPKHVIESRWVHDTAHVLAEAVLRARLAAERRKNRRH